jgi:hypothetical protein
VERFLQRSPKRHGLSVTLRAVELAGPWKVVALLRLGPFPYHWLNYVLVRTLLLLLVAIWCRDCFTQCVWLACVLISP